MKNIIKTDLSRALRSWRFPVAVILMFFVWELNSKRFVNSQDVLYVFIHTWGRSITPLLAMVVTSTVYVSSYCEDEENYFVRYSIQRVGMRGYILSKIIVTFLTAFFVLVLGSIIFLVKQSNELPLISSGSLAVENFKPESCFGWLLPERPNLYMGIQIFLDGLYCASMSVLSLALSAFVQNSYAVYAFPFLLNYFFIFLFSRIAYKYPMLYMEEIYNSATATYTDDPVRLMLYALFVTLVFLVLSTVIMFKKIGDKYQ